MTRAISNVFKLCQDWSVVLMAASFLRSQSREVARRGGTSRGKTPWLLAASGFRATFIHSAAGADFRTKSSMNLCGWRGDEMRQLSSSTTASETADSGDVDRNIEFWRRQQIAELSILHTRDRQDRR